MDESTFVTVFANINSLEEAILNQILQFKYSLFSHFVQEAIFLSIKYPSSVFTLTMSITLVMQRTEFVDIFIAYVG